MHRSGLTQRIPNMCHMIFLWYRVSMLQQDLSKPSARVLARVKSGRVPWDITKTRLFRMYNRLEEVTRSANILGSNFSCWYLITHYVWNQRLTWTISPQLTAQLVPFLVNGTLAGPFCFCARTMFSNCLDVSRPPLLLLWLAQPLSCCLVFKVWHPYHQ